jgi:hypothetical protein
MRLRAPLRSFTVAILFTMTLSAADIPLTNWSAPPAWNPTNSDGRFSIAANTGLTQGMPFFAITPCRAYDSRVAAGGAGPIPAANARTIDIDGGACGPIPMGVGAYSLNITVFGSTATASYAFITAYPTGSTRPPVSSLNFLLGTQVSNAVIVPAGTAGDIEIYASSATEVVVDINGYYSKFFNDGQSLEARVSNSIAVYGVSDSSFAVYGLSSNNHGVYGRTEGTIPSAGIRGISINGRGVFGESTNAAGVYGSSANNNGVFGRTDGPSPASGIRGLSVNGRGVFGESTNSTGVYGLSSIGAGVYGVSSSGYGVYGWTGGASAAAVLGQSSNGKGVYGTSADDLGVYGRSNTAHGVVGENINSSNSGVLGANSYGVYSFGNLGASGTKSFVEPHPEDPNLVVKYVSFEGNEAGTYFRGRARTSGRFAVIDVPHDFRIVTDAEGLSVQVTAIGDIAQFAVVEATLDRIVIKSNSETEFYYTVNGVRRAYRDFNPIQRGDSEFIPRAADDRMPEHLSDEAKRRLIANGTYNPDGTVNMSTAERTGWAQAWRNREEADRNRQ